ncbi:MAG: hypothetical protein RR619_03730, partial [Raoultibacter sp.]
YGEALPGMTLTVSGATVAPAEYSLRYFYDAACLNPVVDANGNIAAASEIGMYYVKAEAKASSKLFAGTTKSAAAKQLVITKATVTPVVGSLTPSYNGEAKAVVVAASSAPNAPVLKEGVDYKVEYSIGGKAVSSAVNAGTYSYKITSLAGGHYTFTTITAGDFVIGKVTVSNAAAVSATNGQLVADSIKPQVFKGSAVAIKPVPTNLGVKVLANDGSTKVIPLTAGVDCMIDSYTANNAIGNAKVNYTFGTTVSNNMTDTAAYIDFKIVAANDLSLATVAAVSDQEATGKAVEPALNVTMDGKKLVAIPTILLCTTTMLILDAPGLLSLALTVALTLEPRPSTSTSSKPLAPPSVSKVQLALRPCQTLSLVASNPLRRLS